MCLENINAHEGGRRTPAQKGNEDRDECVWRRRIMRKWKVASEMR